MSHDLLASGFPLTEQAMRSSAVYLFLLVALRRAAKRGLGRRNTFDLAVASTNWQGLGTAE